MRLFEEAGYVAMASRWPDSLVIKGDPGQRRPIIAQSGIDQVADQFDRTIRSLNRKPAIIGHSFGGLMAQVLAGRALSAATVAIDPAPLRGSLPLPLSEPRLAHPTPGAAAGRDRAIPLTYGQFRASYAVDLGEDEAKQLYEAFAVSGDEDLSLPAGSAKSVSWVDASVDTAHPERGPLLIIAGAKDQAAPSPCAEAAFSEQRRNSSATEIKLMRNRGRALTIDHGWREVAYTALSFVRRFV